MIDFPQRLRYSRRRFQKEVTLLKHILAAVAALLLMLLPALAEEESSFLSFQASPHVTIQSPVPGQSY